MAKAKSPKLRTLITLHTLFKYTDESHRLNSVKLDDFLHPYGLECNKKVIMDTAAKLQEAGIPVNLAGGGPYKGICLSNRPLPDHELKRLIYAIESNPYITEEQARELLDALKPAVTVFQEPMLQTIVENDPLHQSVDAPDSEKIHLIHQAMSQSHRVCCSTLRYDVNKRTKQVTKRLLREETYLPRYLIARCDDYYMVAYNHSRQRIEALALKSIAAIRPAQYNNLPEVQELLEMLDTINPYDYLPEESPVVYEGPVVFYCGAKLLQSLYDHFGAPSGKVSRDERYRLTYPVSHTVITPQTLQWLVDIPDHGIRIIGPEPAVEAVNSYFYDTSTCLLGEQTAEERTASWQKKNP